MNEIITGWADYCDGKSENDEWDFIGLLYRKWTDNDLNEIFRLVPLKDAVIGNLKQVCQNSEEERW